MPSKTVGAPIGRLIALEGTSGPDLMETAARLARSFRKGKDGEGGFSAWDASGTFYELRLGKAKNLHPSPQTLVLLYASDLVFRLRWEIRPALEEGKFVIAAPYVETGIALGEAVGLPHRWLVDLFRFAPQPSVCYRIKEKQKRKKVWKMKAAEGFIEFCSAMLQAAAPDYWDPTEVRRKALGYLETLESKRACQRVGKKLLKG